MKRLLLALCVALGAVGLGIVGGVGAQTTISPAPATSVTINSTTGAIPYKSGASAFSDSPLTRTSSSVVTSTAGLVFSPDNSVDIGASGATRPRTGYFGTSVVAPQLNYASVLVQGSDLARGSGNSFLVNSTGQFGFSSTAVSSGTVDTGLARASAGVVKVTNGSTGAGVLLLPGMTFASLPASPVAGMHATVTDSTTNVWGATITGGGANTVSAFYNGSAWTVEGK